MYMFKGKTLGGFEWVELQSNPDLEWSTIEPRSAGNLGIWKITDDNNLYCYVFCDEVEQCSQPYPTLEEVRSAMESYIENL